MMFRRAFVASSFVAAVVMPVLALAEDRSLGIDPVYQETPVWCWAAVGQMVFQHNGVGNINPGGDFQCGIVALLHPICNRDCRNCVVPAGSLFTMNNMLTEYPKVAVQRTGLRTSITTATKPSALPLSTVVSEIDAGRPVVAGISPSGYNTSNVSEHVALIVGYDGTDLIVNDPFPCDLAITGNPYVASGGTKLGEGQYRVSYKTFVNRLVWRESIYQIKCSGSDCQGRSSSTSTRELNSDVPPVQYGNSCGTLYGSCGPFFNQPALPLGTPCHCGLVDGRVIQP